MSNLKYGLGLLGSTFRVLFRRLFGKKQVQTWNLKTELIWATTRSTLLRSNQLGLESLKKLSSGYKPKPKLKDQITVSREKNSVGNFLRIVPTKQQSKTTIIYLHGGGYVTGSPDAIIEFTSRIAVHTQSEILVPFYPTAPESLYPKAHQFTHQITSEIINANPTQQYCLAGDSAGAALVLSSFQNLSKEQQDKINACVLISPWVQPLTKEGTVQTNAENDVADGEYLIKCYDTYLAKGTLQAQYLMSFDQSNLIQLPKTFISIGTHEMLLDQTIQLEANLKSLGTATHLVKYDTMFHTFWNHATMIPAADQLLEDIAKWLNDK